MSADDHLSSEDQAVLEHLDQQVAEADAAAEYEALIDALRAELREHKAEFRRFRYDVTQQLDDLEAEVEASTATQDTASLTELERLAQLSPGVWDAQLSTSMVIALMLDANWDEIAWSMGNADNRKVGVDTKTKANAKYNPSKLKFRLQKALGWEPEWEQIYRGLKKLAALSDSEECVKEDTGRVQVIGEISHDHYFAQTLCCHENSLYQHCVVCVLLKMTILSVLLKVNVTGQHSHARHRGKQLQKDDETGSLVPFYQLP